MSYHMIGYIHEDPDALQRTLDANETTVQRLAVQVYERNIKRILVTGIGSSHTVGIMARPVFLYHCPLPTQFMSAPEMQYYAGKLIDESTMVIVVSRSGERGAVLDALDDSVHRGALTVAVTGSPDSLMAQKAGTVLVTHEGPEITFPKTKSVVACTGLLMRIGLALASPVDGEAGDRLRKLRDTPALIAHAIESLEPDIRGLVPGLAHRGLVAIAGTGSNYGVALEGALKLQETVGISARADTTDGLINGPIGALSEAWVAVPLVTRVDLGLSNELLRLIRARNAMSLCLSEPDLPLDGSASHVLVLPDAADLLLAALMYLPPIQLLTYYWAVSRNLDPDAPEAMREILDAILPEGREEPELR
jgi:glucosamine--fructose-6-phosphate aminotransferase (isomerizing)